MSCATFNIKLNRFAYVTIFVYTSELLDMGVEFIFLEKPNV